MIRIALLRVLLALATAACGARAACAQPVPDPQAIYDAARKAWAFTSYPRYANYVLAVHYRNGPTPVTRHYELLQDLRRSIVFAHTFSREEAANPSTPPGGVNIGILGATVNSAQEADPIGPLALALNYDFGISPAPVQTQVVQMGSQITAPTRLQVIGRSGATARTYRVRLIDVLEGGATYHLGLTPLRDPARNRLREMWVTAGTSIVQKILIAANFASKPYTDVAWLVTFRQIDGGPYIAEERAQGPLDFGDAGTLDDVTIDFEDVHSTSDLPHVGTVGINGGETKFVTEP